MTTQTKPKPQIKQPKTKKTPSQKKGVSKKDVFTRDDFLAALDKVIAAPTPIEQVQTPKKQPVKVK